MMQEYGFDPEYTEKCLDANKHNHVTTTYYLFLKRLKKEGKLQCEYEAYRLKKAEVSSRKEMSAESKAEYEASLRKQKLEMAKRI